MKTKIALSLLLTASVSQAGQHSLGYLNLDPDSYMSGSMNININRVAEPGSFISAEIVASASGSNAGMVRFAAAKAKPSNPIADRFNCVVLPNDDLYDHAVEVASSVSSGSTLYVRKGPNSRCNYISHSKSSVFLD